MSVQGYFTATGLYRGENSDGVDKKTGNLTEESHKTVVYFTTLRYKQKFVRISIVNSLKTHKNYHITHQLCFCSGLCRNIRSFIVTCLLQACSTNQ